MGKKKHRKRGDVARTPDGGPGARPAEARESADAAQSGTPALPDPSTVRSRQLDLMLRAYLERCLQQIWDQHELFTDADGDYPWRGATSACWVGPVGGPQPSVRVFAHAAFDVPDRAAVHRELADVSARSRWADVVRDRSGVVLVSREIHWTALQVDELEHVMRAVQTVADDIGPLLAAVHGGSTPYALEDADPDGTTDGEVA